MTPLAGWGRYPRQDAQLLLPLTASQCAQQLRDGAGGALIARGQGRAYGDSALAPHVMAMRQLDHLLAFDPATGLLRCAAGVTLDTLLRVFVPQGWFPPVTPGTRHVTVGGAIASDVHGKNHHLDGTFCDHVRALELVLGNGERVTTSPTAHPELFHATCGGMGLTGVIVAATVQLKPVRSSEVIETTIKTANLEATLAAFEQHRASTYSVAWIDCLARGARLGRSLLMLGEHAPDGALAVRDGGALPVPLDMPAGLLNRASIGAFNALYYHRAWRRHSTRRIPFEPFFYPLDALAGWNRLYGKAGFLQYQFVLPKQAGVAAMREVLSAIADSGRGSFLAVLKTFGPANANYLSFPTEGYTLALDFKAEPAVFALLERLDPIVLGHGGRLYLAKDARMSAATFRHSYPHWQRFEQVRADWHAHGHFASLQSRRLGLL
ncbi:FAD-binding oxidoreductase [Rugamonas apoptosis]|uniref:FAD-binding oxidoreductase n=1 Tax=Rugamonas apoptosis TaxID=2758570 RepID=A0A7W2IIR0_9BURK|nr:FAD-binding oxidoreductase [Rugamonas apoptosis]MBA5685758.1 FAD-binding oxidoreductase [Rugamonas apoptosis]